MTRNLLEMKYKGRHEESVRKYTAFEAGGKLFERLNIDFKGPLPTVSRKQYMLTVVDQFSHFPFTIPCKDMNYMINHRKNIDFSLLVYIMYTSLYML